MLVMILSYKSIPAAERKKKMVREQATAKRAMSFLKAIGRSSAVVTPSTHMFSLKKKKKRKKRKKQKREKGGERKEERKGGRKYKGYSLRKTMYSLPVALNKRSGTAQPITSRLATNVLKLYIFNLKVDINSAGDFFLFLLLFSYLSSSCLSSSLGFRIRKYK